MCRLFSLEDTKIITVDIYHQYLCSESKKLAGKNTSFMLGDVTKILETLTPELLQSLPHPWIVTDDSHVKVDKVLLGKSVVGTMFIRIFSKMKLS